jgi:hypothetical protein
MYNLEYEEELRNSLKALLMLQGEEEAQGIAPVADEVEYSSPSFEKR